MGKSNVRTVKKDLRSNRRGGFYWLEGVPYVSVTQVLRVIDRPALRYWFGQQVYRAFVKDPTLSEKDALSAPYRQSDKAKSRGSTVHSIVEAYKKTGAVIEDIPEEFRGYAEAFYSWIKDNSVEVISQEKTVISKKHGYAGTLDLIVSISDSGTWLIDVKTGKGIYPESWLQLSAYKEALEEEGGKVDEIAVLLLKDNGKYMFEKGEADIEVFLACKKMWIWQNKELYAQMMKGAKSVDSNKLGGGGNNGDD